jgi:hypothetical protein
MNSAHYFLHAYRLDFYMKKLFLPSSFEKNLWSKKSLKIPLVEIILFENQDDLCILWNLGI